MTLSFRNITVSPDADVKDWGFEGLLTAVDRGSLKDWHAIAQELRADPWGQVARSLPAVLAVAEDSGVAATLTLLLERIRVEAHEAERSEIAALFRAAVTSSGLSQRQFAERIGTSPSRLSTYLAGTTMPSAAMLLRAQRLGALVALTSAK